jgi:hypothetical protein
MRLLFAIAIIGCSGNASPLDPPNRHLATELAKKIGKPLGECERWTDDSVLCRPSETRLTWCEAKADGKPHCELAVDWTPQAVQPEAEKLPPPPLPPVKKPSLPKSDLFPKK